MKKISLLAFVGYAAGIGAYALQEKLVGADTEAEHDNMRVVEEKAHGDINDDTHLFLDTEMFIGIKHIEEVGVESESHN